MSEGEKQRRREWFRHHWQNGVAFNAASGMTVERWDADGVEMRLPYRDDLSAHAGIFHGGVLSALVDTAGTGAVMAGHDFDKGSRLSTISMSVQYLGVDPGADVVAYAHCTRRGRAVHFAEVTVRSTNGKDLAQGLVSCSIIGDRPGLSDGSLDQ